MCTIKQLKKFSTLKIIVLIFIFFFITISLVISVNLKTERSLGVERLLVTMVERLGPSAILIYETQGPDIFQKWIETTEKRGNVHILYKLYDSNGNNVIKSANNSFPEDLFIISNLNNGKAVSARLDGNASVIVIPETGSSGGKYYFLGKVNKDPFPFSTSPVNRIWKIFIKNNAILLMLFAFTSLIGLHLINHFILKPIEILSNATDSIIQGDYNLKVSSLISTRYKEIVKFASGFDLMALKVSSTLEHQKKLIDILSHEYQSPLTRIEIAIGLAFQKPKNNLFKKELTIIQNECKNLRDTTKQLLLFSKINSISVCGNLVQINLTNLLKDIIQDITIISSKSNVEIRLNSTNDFILRGNLPLLRIAFENIIQNALSFSPLNSYIDIEIKENEKYTSIYIRDYGPGIPDIHIFDNFHDNKITSNFTIGGRESNGIGVSIVKSIINKHGGSIKAENHPNGGLIVQLELINHL